MLDFGAIEFKVKGDLNAHFERLSWEERDVHTTLVFGLGAIGENYADIEEIADATAKALAEKKGTEVRWNYRGSTQGHYVSADGYVNLDTVKIVEVTE